MDISDKSKHYASRRRKRERLIREIGEGTAVAVFRVDKGHPDGPEEHVVTSTGIIVVYNVLSGKLVTKLIARPGQIQRYYNPYGWPIPQRVLGLAKEHQALGYHKC